MINIKKLTLASMLIALCVVCSTFYIPIGASKCFPIQHMVNVLSAVLLGPFYGVTMAFVTSTIRFSMGTGSVLAFPGSMVGALFCGVIYNYTKNMKLTFLGEVIGTGFFGAIIAYFMSITFMAKSVAIFAYVIPFGVSTLGGSIMAVGLISILKKTGAFNVIDFDCRV